MLKFEDFLSSLEREEKAFMGAINRLAVTFYGWVMAFLLPGMGCFYTLSYWSDYFKRVLETFLSSTSNFSLLIVVLLSSLVLGKLVSACSSLLYDGLLCRRFRIDLLEAMELKEEDNRRLYYELLDKNYRYYQCLGGFSFILPVLFISWLWRTWGWLDSAEIMMIAQGFLIGEFAVIRVALVTYRECAIGLARLRQRETRDAKEGDSVVGLYEVRSKKSKGA